MISYLKCNEIMIAKGLCKTCNMQTHYDYIKSSSYSTHTVNKLVDRTCSLTNSSLIRYTKRI